MSTRKLTEAEENHLQRIFNILGGEAPRSQTEARITAKKIKERWASSGHRLEVASAMIGGLENNTRALHQISGDGINIFRAFLGTLEKDPLSHPSFPAVVRRLSTAAGLATATA